jgi:hypothetical protein
MGKLLLLVSIVSLSCGVVLDAKEIASTSFEKNYTHLDSLILWSENYHLKWSDFLGKADYSGEFKDHQAVTWVKRKSTNWIINDSTISFDYFCYFDRYESWKKIETARLLSHEQGHFNLAEIYLRNLRKSLCEYKSYSLQETSNFFTDQGKLVRSELQKVHNLYDSETNFSKDSVAQKMWDQKIIDMLVDTKPWANTKVVIRRYKK